MIWWATYECSLNSVHSTLANLKFTWSGPADLTFKLAHTKGDDTDGNCAQAHTVCQQYNRSSGIIMASNGECIKGLNCDGQLDENLPEFYKNFQCVEQGNDNIFFVFDIYTNRI